MCHGSKVQREKGQCGWRWWLKRMRGHLRHGTETGGTGGGETEVVVASLLLP